MLKIFIFIFLVFSQRLFAQSQFADDVYHCSNNVFQNTPCPPPARKPVISKQPISADADCQQEGELAEAIADRREVGIRAEVLIANPPTGATEEFIKKVYSRKGSSFQINSATARECMQQKAKNRLTKRKPNETQKLTLPEVKPATEMPVSQPVVVPTPQPAPAPVAEPAAVAESVNSNETKMETPQDLQDPQGICSSLQAGLDNIAKQRKNGTGIEADLKRQQKELKSVMKSSGC